MEFITNMHSLLNLLLLMTEVPHAGVEHDFVIRIIVYFGHTDI